MLLKSHLQKYRLSGSPDAYKSVQLIKKFHRFPKDSKRPGPRMGFGVRLNLFRTSKSDSCTGVRFTRKKGAQISEKPGKEAAGNASK